tara:strand:- start:6582 stop:7127 length:546 start_codon:yes stop_codon:yes gene_type:complete
MKFLVNLLTTIRIILAFFIFGLIMQSNGYVLAFFLFMFAGITDFLDGYLARKYNLQSVIGEILDPIADKILIVFILFALAINLSSYMVGFFASLIISREILVSALRDYNSRNNNTSATKVTFLAKFKTTSQIFTISLYLFALAIDSMLLLIISDLFLAVSTIITLYTGYIYIYNSVAKERD